MGKTIIKKKQTVDPTLNNLKKWLRQSESFSPDERCDKIREYKNKIDKDSNLTITNVIRRSNECIEKIPELCNAKEYARFKIAVLLNCNIGSSRCGSVYVRTHENGKLRPNTEIIREV